MTENNLGNTQYFRTKPDQELEVKEVLDLVYNAMDEKGYKMCIRDRAQTAAQEATFLWR